MRVAMIGSGYVGLVSGACFSEFGIEVICVDKDADKIARLQGGEVGLAECGGTFNTGDDLKTDADGKVVIVAVVGTTNQNSVAVALEDGAVGKIVRVRREPKVIRPALT